MKKNLIKWGLIVLVSGMIVGGGIVLYLNMPHRDVQATEANFQMSAVELVKEYFTDAQSANDKYLAENGESKIIEVTGVVASIDEDMKGQKVVLLKNIDENAGVSCTFMESTNANVAHLKIGDNITVKGVIRSGAGYDEDLELYEDVIMEKCDLIKK